MRKVKLKPKRTNLFILFEDRDSGVRRPFSSSPICRNMNVTEPSGVHFSSHNPNNNSTCGTLNVFVLMSIPEPSLTAAGPGTGRPRTPPGPDGSLPQRPLQTGDLSEAENHETNAQRLLKINHSAEKMHVSGVITHHQEDVDCQSDF